MAYVVARGTREIGIRVALGANKSDVFRLVVRQGIVPAIIGTAAGIACALTVSRYLQSLLYGVRPTNAPTFVVVALLLLGVSIAACYVPTRRAMRVDPMVALRYE